MSAKEETGKAKMTDAPDERETVNTLPTWRVIVDMVRFRWKLWLGNLGAMLLLIAFWQIPGFIMKAFFDLLSSQSVAGTLGRLDTRRVPDRV